MPVFDGLFPEPWNGIVQTMLFELANFYSLARLRLHVLDRLVERHDHVGLERREVVGR